MIIDVHVHLGIDRCYDEVRTEEEIIQSMEENKVDVSIVQPMFGAVYLEDIKEEHNRIYKFSQAYPKRIFGMASMTPLIHEADYYNEAKRCMKELGFVGIKLNPGVHGVSPSLKKGEIPWKVCSELGVPLMVHTGPGGAFALPANVIGRCRQYKNVQCILAHSGLVSFAGEALFAAQECSNIILETTWTAAHHVAIFIKLFGAKRVMFGSDEVSNLPVELAKFRSLHISKEDLEACLGKTANQEYKLNLN
jgi:uncharacterized protein